MCSQLLGPRVDVPGVYEQKARSSRTGPSSLLSYSLVGELAVSAYAASSPSELKTRPTATAPWRIAVLVRGPPASRAEKSVTSTP